MSTPEMIRALREERSRSHCEGCNTTENLQPCEGGRAYRCPECAELQSRYDEAKKHLSTIPDAPLAEWERHWRAHGLSALQISEVLDRVGDAVKKPGGALR